MSVTSFRTTIWRFMTDRSLSTWLLVGLTAMLIISSLLPNPEYMGQDAAAALQARNPLLYDMGRKFNGRKVATGYLFASMGIYLIVSATLCSIERLAARRKELPATCAATGTSTLSARMPAAGVEESCRLIGSWLRRRLPGAIVSIDSGCGMVTARRGRFGFWGSILFHFILIFALFGVVLLQLGGTRGKLIFTEGQRYTLEPSRLAHVEQEPLWGLRLPRVELELLEHLSVYSPDEPETAVEHIARFRVGDLATGQSTVRDMKINRPLSLGGKDFLLITGGFSPRFAVSGGGAAFDSCVNLRQEAGTSDDFSPVSGLHFAVRFLPDMIRGEAGPVVGTRAMSNPAVRMSVLRGEKNLFDGIVPVGTSIHVGEFTVTIPEVRRWVEVEVVNEPGMGLFFLLSFFGILGILLRVLDPDEQMTVVVTAAETETRLMFFVESRHFPALLQGIARDCAQAVASPGAIGADEGGT